MSQKIAIIGSGFSSLSAAAVLAKAGYKVDVYEKNNCLGGRAQMFETEGFRFDMGPSWYWMPDVFEDFYKLFGYQASDFYELVRLDPSYSVFFKEDRVDMPASMAELLDLFENIEKGSAIKLTKFLQEAKYKYEVGMSEYVWKPSDSITEFFDVKIFKSAFKLEMFSSISKQIRSLFKNPKLREILEFPVLFLGATPQKIPALYALMNYADLSLGTWYPLGGMHEIVKAFVQIGEEQGVSFHLNKEVSEILVENNKACGLKFTNSNATNCDYLIAGADYYHVEQSLLPSKYRRYTESYWDKRVMAPSSLLYYVGVKGKIDGLSHHNLFFDADFSNHAYEIYESPQYPTDPLFYVCNPSKTDNSIAPDGHENLFFLIPTAPDLPEDTLAIDKYFNLILDRVHDKIGIDLKNRIVYRKNFTIANFKDEYNSFKGNAYGLANTLNQTALLKPRMKSNKLKNLFYTGQLTVPGPGVPPSIISGQIAADLIMQNK